jgi:DNA polymerase-1
MSNTVLLLDADIFCFQICAAVEREIDWGDDLWTLHSDHQEAVQRLEAEVEYLMEKLDASEVVLCFTDGENFRKSVYPQYKTNRKDTRKPLAYRALVDHCKETYETFTRPNLEADDVLGILATWRKFKPGMKKVIVSEDKDLKTIQGAWLFNPAKDDEPYLNDPDEAYRYFLEQTLTGDMTDGYPGCPGIGAETAKALLAEPYGWEQYEHTFKSGPRKDQTEMRWRKCEVGSVWEAIVAQYVKAGLTEEDAITQARCARILHASDYDFKKKEPILWQPPSSDSSCTTS